MLEGVSMAMPCPDNLSLFCCCCCWGNTESLFNPNVAGLRSGCCCIPLLFGFIMFMTEKGGEQPWWLNLYSKLLFVECHQPLTEI